MDLASALSLFDVLLRLAVGAAVATLAGAGGAWASARLGDDGPRHDGRLTFNPVPHVSLAPLVAAVLFQVAWPAPLAIRSGRSGRAAWRAFMLPLALAAILAITALAALALRPVVLGVAGDQAGLGLASVLAAVFHVAIRSALVNLLPIPPLPGVTMVAACSQRAGTWAHRNWARWLGTGAVLALLTIDQRTRWLASWATSFAGAFGFGAP